MSCRYRIGSESFLSVVGDSKGGGGAQFLSVKFPSRPKWGPGPVSEPKRRELDGKLAVNNGDDVGGEGDDNDDDDDDVTSMRNIFIPFPEQNVSSD